MGLTSDSLHPPVSLTSVFTTAVGALWKKPNVEMYRRLFAVKPTNTVLLFLEIC